MNIQLEDVMSRLTLNQDRPFLSSIFGQSLEKEVYSYGAAQQGVAAGILACKLGLSAIDAIMKQKFHEIDPLVSETQCHTRVGLIIDIAQEVLDTDSDLFQSFQSAKQALENLKGKLCLTLKECNNAKLRNLKIPNSTTITSLFGEGIGTQVSQEVLTVTLCYMLTKTKIVKKELVSCEDCHATVANMSDITCEGKLDSIQKNIDSSIRDKMVTLAKETLSKISCDYIQKVALSSSSETVQKMLGEKNRKIMPVLKYDHALSMLPFAYTAQAMFDQAIQKNIPILIKSKLTQHTTTCSHEPFDAIFLLHNKKSIPFLELIFISKLNQSSTKFFNGASEGT